MMHAIKYHARKQKLDNDALVAAILRTRQNNKFRPSRWKTVRHMVQWTPFIQTYKKKKYPWVQLAGHSGNFKAGTSQGTVLKKLCPQEEACYQAIMKDPTM